MDASPVWLMSMTDDDIDLLHQTYLMLRDVGVDTASLSAVADESWDTHVDTAYQALGVMLELLAAHGRGPGPESEDGEGGPDEADAGTAGADDRGSPVIPLSRP